MDEMDRIAEDRSYRWHPLPYGTLGLRRSTVLSRPGFDLCLAVGSVRATSQIAEESVSVVGLRGVIEQAVSYMLVSVARAEVSSLLDAMDSLLRQVRV